MRIWAIALLGACGGARPPLAASCPASIPAEVAAPANQELSLVLEGRGIQHYECTGTDTFAWTFVSPKADLFDGERKVGTHDAGPTWHSIDGSSVVGRKVASAIVDPKAIPWFLLDVTSHGEQPGVLTDVTAIQRLDTTGGLPPTIACDGAHVGAKSDAPYTARYFFYRTSSRPSGRCDAH